jgi:hypothetical protein
MRYIAYVKGSPTEPEVAILQLDGTDHEKLHKDPLGFLMEHHIFREPVREARQLLHFPDEKPAIKKNSGPAWLTMLIHRRDCTLVGACTSLQA